MTGNRNGNYGLLRKSSHELPSYNLPEQFYEPYAPDDSLMRRKTVRVRSSKDAEIVTRQSEIVTRHWYNNMKHWYREMRH
jgi:hypothetical protein